MINYFFSIHKKNGEYTHVSKDVQFISGYKPNELIGNMCNIYFHPDDLLRITKSHLELINDNIQKIVWRIHSKKDNNYIWLKTYSNYLNEIILCLNIKLDFFDILIYKINQNSKYISKNFYFSTHKKNGEYIHISKEIENVLGFKPEELIGNKINKYFRSDDLLRITKSHLDTLNKGIQKTTLRMYSKKDNTYIWVKIYSDFFTNSTGIKEYICLTVRIKWIEIIYFKIKLLLNIEN